MREVWKDVSDCGVGTVGGPSAKTGKTKRMDAREPSVGWIDASIGADRKISTSTRAEIEAEAEASHESSQYLTLLYVHTVHTRDYEVTLPELSCGDKHPH